MRTLCLTLKLQGEALYSQNFNYERIIRRIELKLFFNIQRRKIIRQLYQNNIFFSYPAILGYRISGVSYVFFLRRPLFIIASFQDQAPPQGAQVVCPRPDQACQVHRLLPHLLVHATLQETSET